MYMGEELGRALKIEKVYELGYIMKDGRVIKGAMINIRDREVADATFEGQEVEVLYNLYFKGIWVASVDAEYIAKCENEYMKGEI